VKGLEDHIEQNRTEMLFKTEQKTTPIGELDGHELTTLEQLQEIKINLSLILYYLHVFF